ncbi:protein FAM229A isoform X2 [Ahaetulla prasina]|uniref:protein FAM229A isoform X2 n=1 Tax=Ahaetulla prasina TaxID=499056 RepID=UPI002649A610|nr:protein FAM229A isoform X2 [Ahaetulla prasina]
MRIHSHLQTGSEASSSFPRPGAYISSAESNWTENSVASGQSGATSDTLVLRLLKWQLRRCPGCHCLTLPNVPIDVYIAMGGSHRPRTT